MLVRVIHKTVRRSGRVSQREELLDVDSPTIGRGTDSDVQLSALAIELRHSRLDRRHDGIYLVPLEAPQLQIGGRRMQERKLRPKDTIEIGNFVLTVLPAAQGEDLCLELSQVGRRQSEREELEKRTRIGLSRGLFTERKLSWLSVLVLPAVFLAVPIATGHLDTSWNSGPIARVHSFIADDCEKCHAVPFEKVRDQECLVCHGEIRSHTPPGLQVVKLDNMRCADCHFEHGGTEGLAALEQDLCAECHKNLGDYAPKTKVRAVSDFGTAHPGFRLLVPTDSLVRKTADPSGIDAMGRPAGKPPAVMAMAPAKPPQPRGDSADWTRTVERMELTKTLQEHSGVKFNHRRHVAQEERNDGSGELLRCGDCHQFDAAGKNMKPLNFEQHCQSCHSLGFDSRYDREALHGDPVEMRRDLLVFYESKELEELEARIQKGEVLRARVGSPEETEQRAAARRNAQARVERADQFLMDEDKPGACANCHIVKKGGASDGLYDVAPVRLLDLWMPKSVFRHETHNPFPCRDCHPAAAVYDAGLAEELVGKGASKGRAGIKKSVTQLRPRPAWSFPGDGRPYALYTPNELMEKHQLEPSEKAVDILLPNIEKCQGCHGGASAPKPKVASECVLCHPFHRQEFDRMRPVVGTPSGLTTSKKHNGIGAG